MTAAAREIYDQALGFEANGDLLRAKTGYLRASDMLPHDTEIAYRAASALLRTGELEEAQSRLRRLIFADPSHINARSSLANCQLLMNDLELAESNFREVLDRDPDHKNALFGLSNLLLKRKQARLAAPYAQRLSALLPNSPAAQTVVAEVLEKGGQAPQAVAAYRKLLKSAPNHIPALLGLARTLLKSKRYDDVISLAVRAAEQDADNSDAFDMLSQALEGRGDSEDALEAASEALRLAPDNTDLLTRLSVICRKLGKFGAALRYALQAVDANPESRGPANALGAALAAMKFPNQARVVLTSGSGKDLDPEIRALVERLIKASEGAAKTPKSTSASVGNSGNNAAQSPEPDQETAEINNATETAANSVVVDDTEAKQTEAGNKTEAIQSSGDGEKPKFGAGPDEPLPNVLGLSRRDVS
ncbi:tetratricopeptide repeat protein [Labrenzia sp. R4_2]|uniref:tetratricopeptide repeat protein n=1 Tax=Labrenzia sp. R4_2 TaxID=2821107 RepID=UPI001ADBFAEA|nr:tetratricopeptide repeat protein [Labrenzia sp. R4_2]MBO9422466.1 tetratricopeptide repeat protein [Labrenzia sp. R4_2]